MIHHISIPARAPRHVAEVLAELMHGYAGPFIGPLAGAYAAYAEDAHGSGIEVYPEDTLVVPSDGGGSLGTRAPGQAVPQSAFHALVSVPASRGEIERVGAREGWLTRHCWRGPTAAPLFELYEFWVENRVLLELVTEDMLAPYVAIAQGAAQRALLARRAAQARAAG
ncbi:MAG: hypothetical protein R3E52_01975 [Burkholderiaceae bacterium]